jgi:hypothetical protein
MRSRSRSGSLASRLRTRWTAQCWRSEAGQHCSTALISPGAPSATISSGAPEPAADQVAAEREPVLVRLAHPEHHQQQHPLAPLGEAPGDQHALLGPVRAHRKEDRVEEQRDQADVVEVAALERLEALPQLGADPLGGRLRQLPQPRLLAQRPRCRASTAP